MKTRTRKIIAAVFSTIMMFQAMSGVLEVAAQELGLVDLANQTGPYYNKSRAQDLEYNTYSNLNNEKEVITKNAESSNSEESYDPELEVVEERTINSKTYEVTPGTYVKEVFFEPVHTEVDGELVDIDNTLENTSRKRSSPVYENKEGYYDVKIENKVLTMSSKEGQSLSITQDGNVDNYDIKDNVILYSEVYENMDMEYILGGNTITNRFTINGPITQETISYTINYGDLEVIEEDEAYLFVDAEGTTVFMYLKPTLIENGVLKQIEMTSEINEDEVKLTINLPTEWIAENERVFPMFIRSGASYEPEKIDVDTSYNRSHTPEVISRYHDLFVGYEDGAQTGHVKLGVTRSYIHIGDLGLGDEKEIVSAELMLNKHTSREKQWKEIEIRKTSGYVNVGAINWNNKPTDLTHVSTTTIDHRPGWHSFNVKSYVEDIYAGKNNIIEMKCTNESEDYIANFFYSESGLALPRIMVTYRDAWDVRPDLDINTMDMEMRVFAKKDEGFYGISFDGIARPDSQVTFDLVKKDTSDVLATEISKREFR
ncbi:MAG: DNRLRE domain-containing protein [Coprobacillaceae bacterium]